MSYSEDIEVLEARLASLRPNGLSTERLQDFEDKKQRLNDRLVRLRYEKAESWGQQDWLAMIEHSIDALGEKVAAWIGPPTRH